MVKKDSFFKITDFHKCTGCFACGFVCKSKSIKTCETDGFIYPMVDASKCVLCGSCEKVCPQNNDYLKYDIKKAYAVKRIANDEGYKYASAGVFASLARIVIEKGGIVCGAAYDEVFNVKHICIDSLSCLDELCTSKYVQSDLFSAYDDIDLALKSGRIVLFSGTPCQVAAINAVFKPYKSQLLSVQVFCHAIPSPAVWQSYLNDLSAGRETVSVNFRYKKKPCDIDTNDLFGYGWKNPIIKITFDDGDNYESRFADDPYINAMTQELITRESCFNCKFKLANYSSGADISIGDFWGLENHIPSFACDSGVSAVLVHTKLGQNYLFKCSELTTKVVDLDIIKQGNKAAFFSDSPHINRSKFFRDYYANPKEIKHNLISQLGYLASYNGRLLFDVFGGYSSRFIVNKICTGSPSYLYRHFSNSTILSACSKPHLIPDWLDYPSNYYRKKSIIDDFSKGLMNYLPVYSNQLFVFDLLEERFSNLLVDNTIITNSDALNDSNFMANCIVKTYRETNIGDIDRFMDVIFTKYSKSNIIMCEYYLMERHGDYGCVLPFADVSQIRHINCRLKQYYDYIERKYEFIRVIEMPSENDLLYSDDGFKHGCYPWHYNTNLYKVLADNLFELVSSIIDKKN